MHQFDETNYYQVENYEENRQAGKYKVISIDRIAETITTRYVDHRDRVFETNREHKLYANMDNTLEYFKPEGNIPGGPVIKASCRAENE